MRRTIIIILCITIMIGCGEITSNHSGDLPVEDQADISYIEPVLLFNDEETHVKDVRIERDYVLLPLYKILCLVGKDWIEDPRFDNYNIWCIEVKGEKYVIDWNKQLFTTLDDYDGTISEETKQHGLFIGVSEERGSNYVSWATREIYIGNEALIQVMEKMGYDVSITWDVVNRTVRLSVVG